MYGTDSQKVKNWDKKHLKDLRKIAAGNDLTVERKIMQK